MTSSTPEQTAFDLTQQWRGQRDHIVFTEATLIAALKEAIEVDRAQRAEIHQDWRDDQDMVRDADHVDVTWTAHAVDGSEYFRSDMTLTAAQAVGMFQGIGEAEREHNLVDDDEEPTSADERDYGKYLDQQFWGDRD